jgi:Protein of unknown function (DUF3176)
VAFGRRRRCFFLISFSFIYSSSLSCFLDFSEEFTSDLSPPDTSKAATPSFWTRLWLDIWWPEIIAMVSNIGCHVGIVCVLMQCNHEQLHRMWFGITVNTAVSILAVASKLSLIYADATTISQARWYWFHKKPQSFYTNNAHVSLILSRLVCTASMSTT